MSHYRVMKIVLLPTVCFLAGCASYEPLELPTDNNPPGPGVLSGEKGYFEIDLDR